MTKTLCRLAIAALLLGGCSHPAPEPAPTRTTAPSPSSSSANPARDLGAGKPGAYCATNRLGKSFVKDGVTYTCKGPKPYRWRP